MRKVIAYGLLGMVCVSGLAGCGFFQRFRDDVRDAQYTRPPARRMAPLTQEGEFVESTVPLRERTIVRVRDTGLAKATSTPISEDAAPRIIVVPDKSTPAPSKPAEFLPLDKNAHKVEVLPLEVNPTPPQKDPATPKVVLPIPEEPSTESTKIGDKVIANKVVEIVYGQTDNFKIVTGQVSQYRKSWRLRYASIEQEDQFGGVVLLEGHAELGKLRDHQHVRVRGTLIPPTDRSSPARYRVESLEILD